MKTEQKIRNAAKALKAATVAAGETAADMRRLAGAARRFSATIAKMRTAYDALANNPAYLAQLEAQQRRFLAGQEPMRGSNGLVIRGHLLQPHPNLTPRQIVANPLHFPLDRQDLHGVAV